jgi:hypothetical protein
MKSTPIIVAGLLAMGLSAAAVRAADTPESRDADLRKEMQVVMEKARARHEERALDAAGVTGTQKTAAMDVLKKSHEAWAKAMREQVQADNARRDQLRSDLINILGKDKAAKFQTTLQEQRDAGGFKRHHGFRPHPGFPMEPMMPPPSGNEDRAPAPQSR